MPPTATPSVNTSGDISQEQWYPVLGSLLGWGTWLVFALAMAGFLWRVGVIVSDVRSSGWDPEQVARLKWPLLAAVVAGNLAAVVNYFV